MADHTVTDKELWNVAGELYCRDFRQIGLQGLTEAELGHIERNHPNDCHERLYKMLQAVMRKEKGSNEDEILATLLFEAQRQDVLNRFVAAREQNRPPKFTSVAMETDYQKPAPPTAPPPYSPGQEIPRQSCRVYSNNNNTYNFTYNHNCTCNHNSQSNNGRPINSYQPPLGWPGSYLPITYSVRLVPATSVVQVSTTGSNVKVCTTTHSPWFAQTIPALTSVSIH